MRPPSPYGYMPAVPSFSVVSVDIADHQMIADEYIYDGFGLPGKNLSPHLRWQGFPPQTRSFGVTCFDVDVATPSGFWHWVLYDIPASVTELPTGAGSPGSTTLPAGVRHARNDYGVPAYGGPAAAKGDEPHRYIFAVHALACDRLDVPDDATPAKVAYHMKQPTLARGLLIPVWGH